MNALLWTLAAELPPASDLERYGMAGALGTFVIYMILHGGPHLMKRWTEIKTQAVTAQNEARTRAADAEREARTQIAAAEKELDNSRTENQKTILGMMQGLHHSAMEITVAQRQLIERSIEATNHAENHADNLGRIVAQRRTN